MYKYIKCMAILLVISFLTLESYRTANLLYYGIYPSFKQTYKSKNHGSEIKNKNYKFEIQNKRISIKKGLVKITNGNISAKEVKKLKIRLLDRVDDLIKKSEHKTELLIDQIRIFQTVISYYRKQGNYEEAQKVYKQGLNAIKNIRQSYSEKGLENWNKILNQIKSYKKQKVLYQEQNVRDGDV